MDAGRSADGMPGGRPPLTLKVLVAGGFGVGKTTLVGAVSEIRPLHTEEVLTSVGADTDDLTGVESKTTTTVSMDFGRITINKQVQIYLFGTPGQARFWFLWDELAYGAFGAIVLADSRRLADCFPPVDYLEERGIPFVVGVNTFAEAPPVDVSTVRQALDLGPGVPVLHCDARHRQSGKGLLVALVEHVAQRRGQPAPAAT